MLNWIMSLFKPSLKLPTNSWIPEADEIKPSDAEFEEVFGATNFGANASRDWRKSRPKHEIQSYGDCVSFSRTNIAETKAKEKGVSDEDGNEFNLSDLDLAVGSGTSKTGNSLQAVAEYARKVGVVLEKYCPYTRNWNERIKRVASIPSGAKRYKLGGHSSLKIDWVSKTVGIDKLKKALDFTPIQIGVGLGETYRGKAGTKENPVTTPKNVSVYHALQCDYIDAEGRKYCFDHYNRQEVVFSADYPVLFAKSFADLPEDWRGKNVADEQFHNRLIGKFIIRSQAHGELYKVHELKLVKVIFDISDKDIWEAVHKTIRPMIIGISEKDFERIKARVLAIGGNIEEPKKVLSLSGLINKLK